MPQIILASTSKYRAALLKRWQLNFVAIDPNVDEELFKSRGLSPRELVKVLSQAKAEAIAAKHPDAIVIGSDQVLSSSGKIYGKAGSESAALAQLMELAGKEQQLLTGLCVVRGKDMVHHLDTTTLTFRNYDRSDAARIIAQDKSWDCAGSLKIEAGGTWLIDSLTTNDPSAIEGLPLIALGKILRDLAPQLLL